MGHRGGSIANARASNRPRWECGKALTATSEWLAYESHHYHNQSRSPQTANFILMVAAGLKHHKDCDAADGRQLFSLLAL